MSFDSIANAIQLPKESLLVQDSSLTFAVLPCVVTDSVSLSRMSGLWSFAYIGSELRVGHVKVHGDTLTVYDFAPRLLLRRFVRTDFDEKSFDQLRRGYFCLSCLDGAWIPDPDSLQSCPEKMKSKFGFDNAEWINSTEESFRRSNKNIRLKFGKRNRFYRIRFVADFDRGRMLLILNPAYGRFRKHTFTYNGKLN